MSVQLSIRTDIFILPAVKNVFSRRYRDVPYTEGVTYFIISHRLLIPSKIIKLKSSRIKFLALNFSLFYLFQSNHRKHLIKPQDKSQKYFSIVIFLKKRLFFQKNYYFCPYKSIN